jgi:RNA polymerase sigma factor (sigma-70 family)
VLRELAPRVLGTLARRSGDFASAEDAVQEALLAAALRWPDDGVPESPSAWLLQTATRRLIDQRRSEQSRRAREDLVALEPSAAGAACDRDDSLTLLLLCCHPALTEPTAIALTLRAVGGLTTLEIARAFLVSEATMARRIARAKQRIRESQVPFRMPTDDELPARLRSVLRVLYLIFNEGYASSAGPHVQRAELAQEAIRLTRMLARGLPDDGEVLSLLALMLLLDARRPARTGADGELIPLAEQDRRLWDRAQIAEGVALLEGAFGKGTPGEYRLQAAIAALHDQAPTASETDWPQIHALYELLERLTGSPVVTLNRAVAAALADGPAAGLAVLDGVEGRLAGSHRVDAVRAYLLELAGDAEGARERYRAAAARATSVPERNHLVLRAARLAGRRTLSP